MNEIMKYMSVTLLSGALPFFLVAAGVHFLNKEKKYRFPGTGWLNIKEVPLPEDLKDYIATDGKKVEYKSSIRWAPYGKVYFCEYDKTYITHWQPFPDVPKDK